ncbi:hypothetical protein T484DRAFT_1779439, partial [Baffinella frigidus]
EEVEALRGAARRDKEELAARQREIFRLDIEVGHAQRDVDALEGKVDELEALVRESHGRLEEAKSEGERRVSELQDALKHQSGSAREEELLEQLEAVRLEVKRLKEKQAQRQHQLLQKTQRLKEKQAQRQNQLLQKTQEERSRVSIEMRGASKELHLRQERINLSEQLIAKLELQMALLSAAVTAASVELSPSHG